VREEHDEKYPRHRNSEAITTARKVLTELGFPLSAEGAARVVASVGPVTEVTDLSGGIVHHVARVRGATGSSVVVKHRGSTCWAVPELPTDQAAIADEARALRLLSRRRPHEFPGLVHFDRDAAVLIMSDLAPLGLPWGMAFLGAAGPAELPRALTTAVTTLGHVHLALRTAEPLRPDGDEAFFRRNLFERVTYHDTPATHRLGDAVAALPRQLVLGDPSPRNLMWSPESVVFFDLEHVHRGARVFDLAFLLAHVALHRRAAGPLLSAAVAAYQRVFPLDPAAAALTGRLVAACLLYRLRNDVVPYEVADPRFDEHLVGRLFATVDRVDPPVDDVAALVS
jgi:hypothetical protein